MNENEELDSPPFTPVQLLEFERRDFSRTFRDTMNRKPCDHFVMAKYNWHWDDLGKMIEP